MKQKINSIINNYLFEFIIFGFVAVLLITTSANSVFIRLNTLAFVLYYLISRVKIYNKFNKEENHLANESIHIHEPPSDMHPAVASYFARETIDLHIVYGVLLSLVNTRKLELNKEGEDYTFTLLDKEVSLLRIDEYVINWLFGDFRTTIKMKEFKEEFSSQKKLDKLTEHLHKIEPLLHEEVSHLLKDNKEEKAKMKKTLLKVTIALIIVGTLTGFIFSLFYLFLYIMLIYKITVSSQKNTEGAIEYSKWHSYRSFLKQRMDAERRSVNDIILWDYHLTYAVSLGVAENALEELDWLQGNLVEVSNGASRTVTIHQKNQKRT